ncbi:MAG: DUF3786 domain-containing protein [Syntrophobacteraceae bacterium]
MKTRVVPLELYKCTPKTNCGKCGGLTCLAFATLVVTGREKISACPYLDEEQLSPLRERLQQQLDAGVGVSREGFQKTMDFLSSEIQKCDFPSRAQSLGAKFEDVSDGRGLLFSYFNESVRVTKSDIVRLSGAELSAWEKILIYIYVIAGGTEPSGVWVGMESLPNSISKIKSLKAHCEDVLARLFSGRIASFSKAVARWGRTINLVEQGVDVAAEFAVFPKLAIRLLFWDELKEEGYECRMKFLFDSRVLQVLDLESLLFACEQITERLSAQE